MNDLINLDPSERKITPRPYRGVIERSKTVRRQLQLQGNQDEAVFQCPIHQKGRVNLVDTRIESHSDRFSIGAKARHF